MLKKILASIRAQGDTTTGAEALALVERARREHIEAEHQLAEARAAYQGSLIADDDKAAIAARAELTRREILVDRAAAAIELAERAHVEAVERDAETERHTRYADARAKIDKAVKALGGYRAHALAIRGIIKAVAEADVAMGAANADLPKGAVALVPAEMQARGLPGEPEIIVSRERKPDALQYVLPEADPAEGSVIQFGYTGPEHLKTEMRPTGIEVTFIPEMPPCDPDPLAAKVLLPDYTPGERFIWVPTGGTNITRSRGSDSHLVLERISQLEAAERQPPEDPRVRHMARTRMEPVPPGSPPMPPKDEPPARLGERVVWQGPDHLRMM